MKKRIAFLVIAMMVAITAAWAVGKLLIYDECGKCKITSTEHKCGKCGSTMTNSSKYEDGYLVITYTCKNSNCKHECYTKQKF